MEQGVLHRGIAHGVYARGHAWVELLLGYGEKQKVRGPRERRARTESVRRSDGVLWAACV